MKKILAYLISFLLSLVATAQTGVTFTDTIRNYFDELRTETKKGYKLWSTDLYGPILFVNPVTRTLYSNYPDSAGILKPDGKFYSGRLPAAINMANTAIDWNGRRWSMLLLPLPANKFDRINLLAHELFHRLQPAIGFPLFNPANNHLDEKEGRIYLRLELAALRKALTAATPSRMRLYLTDAVTFRKYRYSIYPAAAVTENELELNEGLAEYTGCILAGRSRKETLLHLNRVLTDFLSTPSFVRSFAYHTIPVYGYLLYATQKHWNKNVTPATNLVDYFIRVFNLILPGDLLKSVENSLSKYNGVTIIAEETARETKTKMLVAAYTRKFVDSSHFELRFEQMNISFDPGNIVPVGDHGSVYPNLRVSDKWGILTVSNGALMSPNWDKITVTIPLKNDSNIFSGDGWTLVLNEGYAVIKDNDNYSLVKK